MIPITRRIARYGWTRDLPDGRDRIFILEEPIAQAHQLPVRVDLEPEMPAIYDQGQLGSCTANATAAVFEHQQIRQGEPQDTPSRLFIYYEERRIEGQPLDQDTGAQVRDGIKVLVSEGAPPEREWPYDISRFAQAPPQKAYLDAKRYEATAYKRILVGPGAPLRTAIFNHQPIAFGFPVPAYFEYPEWDPAIQPLPLPGANTQIVGGHAVAVVGYDYTQTRFREPVFKIRNSWGPDWGERGHFYMPVSWFSTSEQLAGDLWVISHTT